MNQNSYNPSPAHFSEYGNGLSRSFNQENPPAGPGGHRLLHEDDQNMHASAHSGFRPQPTPVFRGFDNSTSRLQMTPRAAGEYGGAPMGSHAELPRMGRLSAPINAAPAGFPSSEFSFRYPVDSPSANAGAGSTSAYMARPPNALPISEPSDDEESLPDMVTRKPKAAKQTKAAGKKRARDVDPEPAGKPKAKKARKPADTPPTPKLVKVKTEPVDRSVTKAAKPAKTRGRQPGAVKYSIPECEALVRYISEKLPIGKAGWQWVMVQYNKWAVAHGFTDRGQTALRTKFEGGFLKTRKPTGVADCPQYLHDAWLAEENIEIKSGTLALDDPEFEDGEASDVIEISSDNNDLEPAPKSGSKTLVKAYRVEPPLDGPPVLRRKRGSAATEAISSITSLLNPASVRQRDEGRYAQTVQATQLSTALAEARDAKTELREVRARLDTITDRMNTEMRRADRAESEFAMMKMMSGGGGSEYRSARRWYGEEHGSPSRHGRPLRQAHRSRSPYRTPARSPHRTPARSPYRTPARSPYRTPARSPYRAPARSPYRTPARASHLSHAEDIENINPLPTPTPFVKCAPSKPIASGSALGPMSILASVASSMHQDMAGSPTATPLEAAGHFANVNGSPYASRRASSPIPWSPSPSAPN